MHTPISQASTFQSTRPLRGATCSAAPRCTSLMDFNPRAPCGARLAALRGDGIIKRISIHAPLAGRDRRLPQLPLSTIHFNPRAPCGARQYHSDTSGKLYQFQSTRPLRGATVVITHPVPFFNISIHAPLAGRDATHAGALMRGYPISIHAPLAGRDVGCVAQSVKDEAFQSTRPLRGATIAGDGMGNIDLFQSTRPLRGATKNRASWCGSLTFQSTRPLRGATPRRDDKIRR